MRSLHRLQVEFSEAILQGRTAAGFPAERLQIYRNNVFLGLEAALAAVYAVVRRLVGDAYFRQVARRLIREYPSRSGNLHDFGRELPALLQALPDIGGLPYLADVASLEWSRHEAFHAADATPLDIEHLATLNDDAQARVRFDLHPSVRLVASRFPILSIWEANQEQEAHVPGIDLAMGADWLLVHRRGFEHRVERLTPGEFSLLSALAGGFPLADACDAATAAEAEVDIAAAMGRLVARGLLIDFHI